MRAEDKMWGKIAVKENKKTLTIGELISKLSALDPLLPVWAYDEQGGTYTFIKEIKAGEYGGFQTCDLITGI